MTDTELAGYREHTVANFAAEKVRAEGVDPDAARKAAADAWESALAKSPDAHVMGRPQNDDEAVGVMWYVVRPEWVCTKVLGSGRRVS